MSETDSLSSIFKRKKKNRVVKPVDFDELFARGHAMSAQLEQQRLNQQNFFGLGADTSGQRSPIVPTTTAPSQTFADFSKESAFKKSQKASGISYEEKVASYLSDQQTNLPVINQNNQPFREQAGNQRQDQVDATSVRKSPYFEKEKPTSFAQGVKPPPSPRSEPPQRGTSSPLPRPISPSTSVTSSKRQLAPHEFLSKLQEFARNAAKDAEMAQPDGLDGSQSKPQQERSYAPKQRDHTTAHQPTVFDTAMTQPLSANRIAPSMGKSYLDKPSSSPDPFGMRVEMDIPPPSDVSQNLLNSLKRQKKKHQQMQQQAQPEMDDVITLDLRKNQEKLEYLSVPSDYNAPPPLSSPLTRGRSPKKSMTINSQPPAASSNLLAADRHIPSQLKPDPLTGHEGSGSTPQLLQADTLASNKFQAPSTSIPQMPQTTNLMPADRHIPSQLRPEPLTTHDQGPLRTAAYSTEDMTPGSPTIQDSDLYKRLQVGLDRLMQSDKFKELAARQDEQDPQQYSQHLGRAEFGTLQRRTASQQAIGRGGYSGPVQPRDPSNERPASAMARFGGGRGSTFSSQHPSRDSSLGRHDSRHVTSNTIPEYYDSYDNYESYYDG